MTDHKRDKKMSHLKVLRERHNDLDSRIKICYDERVPDNKIVQMKQEKLHLKEEIEKLERELLVE
jgi:uncharacterized protein YdcH (DUF465 family)